MRFTTRICVVCVCLVMPASAVAGDWDYTPIIRGAPVMTVGAGTRVQLPQIPEIGHPALGSDKSFDLLGDEKCSVPVALLAPAFGVTISTQPVLYFAVKTDLARIGQPLELRMEKIADAGWGDERKRPERFGPVSIPGSEDFESATYGIDLGEYGVELTEMAIYRWSIGRSGEVACEDRGSGSVDFAVVPPPADLSAQLRAATSVGKLLAKNGIWYDAFHAAPADGRRDLLEVLRGQALNH